MKRFLSLILVVFALTACGGAPEAQAGQKAQIFQSLLAGLRFDGATASGYKVHFYIPGTTTAKAVYLDRNKATQAANPYTLNADGRAEVFGDGTYDVVVKTPAGAIKATWENVTLQDTTRFAYQVTDFANLAAAVTAIGSTPATLEFAADQTLAANLTVPATLELVPVNGAKIIHGTYTVSYSGPTAKWGRQQVFSGTGTITGLSYVMPEWFGAKADWNGSGGTDSGAAINRAATALTSGGTMDLRGRYYSTVAIANPDKVIHLRGGAAPGVTDLTVGTSITFATGVPGIQLDGTGSQMSDIAVISQDNGAGAAIGIDVKGAKQVFRNVSVQKFGGKGWRLDSTVNGNVNLARLDNCTAYYNGAEGLYIAGADSNSHMITLFNSTANLTTQIYCQGSRNRFLGCHIDSAGRGNRAVYDNALANYWDVYVESAGGGGSNFELGDSSGMGVLEGLYYALPTVTGNTTAMQSWRIYERYSYRQMVISDRNGGWNTGKQWKFLNGVSTSGTLQLSVSDPDGTNSVDALKITGDGSRLVTTGTVEPGATATKDIGTSTARWRDVYASQSINLNGITIKTGTGTPEGAVSAPVGSLFLRNDGGASTTLYVKTSGTGNTGWTAK